MVFGLLGFGADDSQRLFEVLGGSSAIGAFESKSVDLNGSIGSNDDFNGFFHGDLFFS